jgi:pimeloyl-ACP methyl ester carboxylesterase
MATFILIHGASANSHYWYLVKPLLEAAGHIVHTPDMPTTDDSADFNTYAAAAISSIDNKSDDIVVVGQSMGAFSAPVAAENLHAKLLVLLAPMLPLPGETPGEWWEHVDYSKALAAYAKQAGFDPHFDPQTTLMHDLPKKMVDELLAAGEPAQSEAIFSKPFPLQAWPGIPTKIIAGEYDRMFPMTLVKRLAKERLSIDNVDIVPSGHLAAFAQPQAVADLLLGYVRALQLAQ